MEFRQCKGPCGQVKPITDFDRGFNTLKDGTRKPYHRNICKKCDAPRTNGKSQVYKAKNREKLAAKQREYHAEHKDQDNLTKRLWYLDNKEGCNERAKAYTYEKRENDVSFVLKERVSNGVRSVLGKKKTGKSTWAHLSYTPDELRDHLENLFEPWMTWDNYGVYRIEDWSDNDQSTWTWQIDHIIPHSTFHYETMDCDEFRECWALSNLRPLSAKQNLIDGPRWTAKKK